MRSAQRLHDTTYNEKIGRLSRLDIYMDPNKRGIACDNGSARLLLDPRIASSEINFVSHAHSDHLPRRNGGTILASDETRMIASLRGVEMENHTAAMHGMELHDSGHILGSKGVLYDGMFYTGDICTRARGFLKGADPPKCKTLITECTFGLPEFSFPPVREVQRRANEIISNLYSRGIPVILVGYQLGKAQTLTQLFEHWGPMYLHDSIKSMNDLHRRLGVPIKEHAGHIKAESLGLLSKKPWIMIAPYSEKAFISTIKERYGALTIGFSGWAGTRFPYARGCDYNIQFSDHCDFNELVKMVERTGAETVYTIHGFVREFAEYLTGRGLDAAPLPIRK